jgi:hypothetical protein
MKTNQKMGLLKRLYDTEWLNLHMVHSGLTETPYVVRGRQSLSHSSPEVG